MHVSVKVNVHVCVFVVRASLCMCMHVFMCVCGHMEDARHHSAIFSRQSAGSQSFLGCYNNSCCYIVTAVGRSYQMGEVVQAGLGGGRWLYTSPVVTSLSVSLLFLYLLHLHCHSVGASCHLPRQLMFKRRTMLSQPLQFLTIIQLEHTLIICLSSTIVHLIHWSLKGAQSFEREAGWL